MSRETQYIGLHERAKQFIKHERGESKFPSVGMFGEDLHLRRYETPSGDIVHEKVQRDEWSSGPVIFTALANEDGKWVKESKWTKREMDKIQ